MLTFNFPTLSKLPVQLSMNEFVPSDMATDGSFLPFQFGDTLLILSLVHPGSVSVIFDVEAEEWTDRMDGSCPVETADKLADLFSKKN